LRAQPSQRTMKEAPPWGDYTLSYIELDRIWIQLKSLWASTCFSWHVLKRLLWGGLYLHAWDNSITIIKYL
jgi:hypothetical protein